MPRKTDWKDTHEIINNCYLCESWTMKKADYYMTTGKTKRTFVGKVMCVCF